MVTELLPRRAVFRVLLEGIGAARDVGEAMAELLCDPVCIGEKRIPTHSQCPKPRAELHAGRGRDCDLDEATRPGIRLVELSPYIRRRFCSVSEGPQTALNGSKQGYLSLHPFFWILHHRFITEKIEKKS